MLFVPDIFTLKCINGIGEIHRNFLLVPKLQLGNRSRDRKQELPSWSLGTSKANAGRALQTLSSRGINAKMSGTKNLCPTWLPVVAHAKIVLEMGCVMRG